MLDLTFPLPGGQGLSDGVVWKGMDFLDPLTDNLATTGGGGASSYLSFLGPKMVATGQPRLDLRLVRALPRWMSPCVPTAHWRGTPLLLRCEHEPGKYRRQPELGGNRVRWCVPTPHPLASTLSQHTLPVAQEVPLWGHLGLLVSRYP